MEPIRQLIRPSSTPGTDWEWREAGLLDRLERAETKAARLTGECERLETELVIARLWVKELALWLDEAQDRTAGMALSPTSAEELDVLSPQTARLLRTGLEPPLPWRKLVAIAAIAALPWPLLGLLAYAVYVLVA